MSNTLYRYHNDHDVMVLETFNVLKRTPRGAWIYDTDRRKRRFILDDSKKRFAYPTKDEAKTSFLARKARQVGILEAQLKNIRASIQALNEDRIGDRTRSFYYWD